ncbi:unnamed protein product [Zymoseptoria tritici ST99CH_3D1]|nr:unnamed protein product [Zymoseptoria tritici ST99CH_3D1]
MTTQDLTSAAIALLVALVLYQVAIVIQRLYFHPLSAFPGPRLAAATYIPEIYYDIFEGEGGQLPFALQRWHKSYGPIVRINPQELHVQDSSWYETLYAPSRPVRKLPNWGHRMKAMESALGASDAATYRKRRTALNPFFTKRKIAEFAPSVQQVCDRIISRLETEYRGTGRVLNITRAWECMASDIATLSVFGQDPRSVDSPDFSSPTNRATESLVEPIKWFTHLSIIPTLIDRLPEWIVTALMPPAELILRQRKVMELAVVEARAAHSDGKGNDHSLIGSLLQQDLPPEEATLPHFTQEAVIVVGAGGETVARTMALATFHVLDNPAVQKRLVEELNTAIPDAAEMPDWNVLSALPYLSACIEESLRLTYGVCEKRSRAYDGGDLMYGEWRIPAGTFVGMSNYDVSHDEEIFPDSFSFIPERWLGDPRAPNGKALSRYNVSFGKGMRSCVGMQLAYLELYLGVATFFRSRLASKARLYETNKSDVEMARDCFVPRAAKKSKGVRVIFES